jgi:uncharacterized membrane protein
MPLYESLSVLADSGLTIVDDLGIIASVTGRLSNLMDFTPIAEAPLAVQIHLATIIPAFFLGTWLIFFSRKGAPAHRLIGASYLVLMTTTATAAIFIPRGRISFFYLFVVLTYFSVFRAIWFLRKKNIPGHKRAMVGLYVGGLLIAGGLTFLPGRMMYRLFFG